MIGYFKAVYDWLAGIGSVLWQGLFDVLRRFKWFVVALVGAILAPLAWVLDRVKAISETLVSTTGELVVTMGQLNLNAAGGLWSQLAQGAALMNCVVPLDILLSTFGVLLTLWFVIFAIRTAYFLYRWIPAKFT
jgi:hypothetical protein